MLTAGNPIRVTFERLELCDGKLSCRVLRGLGVSNGPRVAGVLNPSNFGLVLLHITGFLILVIPSNITT